MEQISKNYFCSLIFIIVLLFLSNWSLAAEFDYDDVDSWIQINPQCGGQRQSPIGIGYQESNEGDSNANFSLINYDKIPLSTKLTNDGHTIKVQFEWDENQTPFLTGEFFGTDEYVLDSMHFHWSRVSSEGSEHVLFGWSGAIEMHLVHYNRNYGSVQNALNFEDGLTVIGGLFDILEQRRRHGDDNKNYYLAATQLSPAMSEIINNVGSVSTPGSSVDIEPFAICEFRPVQFNKTAYISYLGSLTTPPCTENVMWLLSTYRYVISKEQLEYLQSTVEFGHGDDHDNRPLQQMNDRRYSITWSVDEHID